MTLESWCDGQPFSYESYGPSPCACYTVLIAAPSGIYILLSLYHIYVVARLIADSPRPCPVRWSYILASYLVLCFLEILFTVAFSADDAHSPARAVGNFLHAVAWFLTGSKAVLITKALPRSALHIDLATWSYFLFDLVAFAVLRSSEYAEDRDRANKAAAVIHFIVGFLAVVLALLIQYREHISELFRQSEDRTLVISRISDVYDFDSLLEYVFGQRYDTSRDRYSFEETSSEAFSKGRGGRSTSGRRSSSSGLFSLHSSVRSWLRGSVDAHGEPCLEEEPIDDDSEDVNDGEGDQDGDGGGDMEDPSTQPLLGGSGGKKTRRKASASASSADHSSGAPPMEGDGPAPSSSSVLRRALERRRNKSSSYLQPLAASPGLGSGLDGAREGGEIIVPGAGGRALALGGGGNGQEFSVYVNGWALLREAETTRRRLPSLSPSTHMSNSSSAAIVDNPMDNGADMLLGITTSSAGGLLQDSSRTVAQVEFEICIRGGPCSEMEWWGRNKVGGDGGGSSSNSNSGGSSSNKWTVWRTAIQIEEMHATMVAVYGDAAPRRPRLHTARVFTTTSNVPATPTAPSSESMSGGAANSSSIVASSGVAMSPGGVGAGMGVGMGEDLGGLSREEIAADMRTIAGYLRAVLNQPSFHCSQLFRFLSVPEHLQGTCLRRNTYAGSSSGNSHTSSSHKQGDLPLPPPMKRLERSGGNLGSGSGSGGGGLSISLSNGNISGLVSGSGSSSVVVSPASATATNGGGGADAFTIASNTSAANAATAANPSGIAGSPSNAAGGTDMGTSSSSNSGGGMSTFIYPPGIVSSEDIRAYHMKLQTDTSTNNAAGSSSAAVLSSAAAPDASAIAAMASLAAASGASYLEDGGNEYDYDYDDAGDESFEEELERESVDVSRQTFYAAAEQKQKQSQQDQYRKLFVNLRKGLKPREHPRRCYSFEGVITGQDVVQWLTTKGNIGSTREAEAIGEALVNAGLLIPVVMGLYPTVPARLGAVSVWEVPGPQLCSSPTYIYIYPGTSSVSNKPRAIYTLFGDVISTSIPTYIKRGSAPSSSSTTNNSSAESNSEAFVEYQIRVSNSTEEWTVFRRYTEFAVLNRLLHRAGIRPREALPTQFLGVLLPQTSDGRLDARRAQLDVYLRSAIGAVMQAAIQRMNAGGPGGYGAAQSAELDKTMVSLAKFLDKDFDKLRFVQAVDNTLEI